MKPRVLFVCVKNGGKSQMAAALLRHHGGESVDVYSAGTQPGVCLNEESVASLDDIGVSCEGEFPKPLDDELAQRVDRIIILGSEAQLPDAALDEKVERWETVEPSRDGIEGAERMRLIRDDIDSRVRQLLTQLSGEE